MSVSNKTARDESCGLKRKKSARQPRVVQGTRLPDERCNSGVQGPRREKFVVMPGEFRTSSVRLKQKRNPPGNFFVAELGKMSIKTAGSKMIARSFSPRPPCSGVWWVKSHDLDSAEWGVESKIEGPRN